MSAGTFSRRIITATYRDIYIVQIIYHHPDPGTCRICAAIFRAGMECGAGDLTGTATNALIKINFYLFNNFLFYWLLSSVGQKALSNITSQTAQSKINKTDFRKIKILIPPTQEQEKIVELLDNKMDQIEMITSELKKEKFAV